MKTNPKKGIVPLKPNATEQEIVKWATKYDAFDRLEAGTSELVADHSDLDELLEEALFQENTAQLNMRYSPGDEGNLIQTGQGADDRCHYTGEDLVGRENSQGVVCEITTRNASGTE